MNSLTQAFRALGMARTIILSGVLLTLIIFFIFMVNRLTAPSMGLLFGNLEVSDASEISTRLDSLGIPYQLKGNGTQVLVPTDQILNLRMTLAGEGLPGGGTVGYEIFDNSESFGATNLVQNMNMMRALEGELGRTVSSLNMIAAARVHLVIPKRELFGRQETTASASITLKIRGSARLGRDLTASIQNLVAAAVPGLTAGRVAIIDNAGNLLARGDGDEDGGAGGASRADDYRAAFESRLTKTVNQLLERTVGIGKVRTEIHAEIDFDRLTTNDEIYNPDGQVIRSQQTVEEKEDNVNSDTNTAVSVSSNLPNQEYQGAATSSSNRTTRTEETINYELSKTLRTHVREGGTVKRLSVAVLVDGTYSENEAGEMIYEARPAADLSQLTLLVKSAVGFNEQRGDLVEVVNMRFATSEAAFGEEETLGVMGDFDIMQILEIVVLGFVAVLVLLLVVRPLLKRMLEANGSMPALGEPVPALAAVQAPAIAAPEFAPAIDAPEAMAVAPAAAPPPPKKRRKTAEEYEEEEDSLIDIARVEGRVKSSHVKKIGEIVDKHPEEALNIVRNWLYAN